MRWYWIDRFVEFTSGVSATSIKNVTMAEEHLHDGFVDYPAMPLPLVVEGIAQTGGLLACEKSGFSNKVVLAKVARATFHAEPMPGDTLRYTTKLLSWDENGSQVEATAVIEGRGGEADRPVAELELFFAHLRGEMFEGRQLFGSRDLLRLFRVFGGYQVGRTKSGEALRDPELVGGSHRPDD
ncbi:MAG: beta-hydroxyacyl-ACP dehydratase [Planctomycetia bacterium]|nr:beta-hydroxyacyl-ACP dehydratase [Planctomycetia bacterium]